jgi:hypothetical protein
MNVNLPNNYVELDDDAKQTVIGSIRMQQEYRRQNPQLMRNWDLDIIYTVVSFVEGYLAGVKSGR